MIIGGADTILLRIFDSLKTKFDNTNDFSDKQIEKSLKTKSLNFENKREKRKKKLKIRSFMFIHE